VSDTPDAESQIEGILDHIVYVNDDTGYTVAVLIAGGAGADAHKVTMVGALGGIEVGSTIRARGRMEKHPRFGEQWRVEDFEVVRPAGSAAIERYLASEIHGVGPSLARRIAVYFGDTLGEVLDTAPSRVREVAGVGPVVALRISAAWRDSSGLRELTVFLRGHGIGSSHARRIHKMYGANALKVVRDDPYVLARTVHGIGFRTADAISEKLGIPRNSIARARAATIYVLERMADEGHVYVPLEYIEGQFSSVLEMDQGLAREAIDELAASGDVIVDHAGDHTAVYLARLYAAEANVAERICALLEARPIATAVVDKAVGAALASGDIRLSTEQASALKTALRSRVTVITGGPGTGKTTILKSMLGALDHAGIKPTLCAPTGRAARRLQDTTGRSAVTIHRLLEFSPETGGFVRGRRFPLRTNFVIVDEASMMDIELASSLMDALMPNCALVLVGDRDQLPSVGPGTVLKDIIASGRVPVVVLSVVYRQARESLIVANAHRLNRGVMPELANDPAGDFFFLERTAPDEVIATIKQLVQTRLVGNFGVASPRDIQVLTPMNRGPLGTHALNAALQALLNPSGRGIQSGDRILREGDRVIQLRNDYDKGVFNGSIGEIISVDTVRARLSVAFEETRADYELADFDEIGLAYAISVHKSQGSQYRAVVMPVHPSHYLMLRRNLLYTAITRAERACVLVGTRKALAQAVRNQDERRRFSRLAERLHID
jgi:exodeoxyribonuclease V alpha subunit